MSILDPASVVLSGTAETRDAAIDEAGGLLLSCGAVDAAYLTAMHDREASVSTYMGSLLAIPHGTNEAKAAIKRTAISFVRYPSTIEWNGNPVEFVIGIAGAGDDHLEVLGTVAMTFMDEAKIATLREASTAEDVVALLG